MLDRAFCFEILYDGQAAAALRAGAVSSEALVQSALVRIGDTAAAGVNCVVSARQDDVALSAARESDVRRRAGKSLGPLDGVPFTVKDNFCVKGSPTTAASGVLAGFTPPYTASCVQNLLNGGAIVVGRTNMDEFGMGSSTAFRYTRGRRGCGLRAMTIALHCLPDCAPLSRCSVLLMSHCPPPLARLTREMQKYMTSWSSFCVCAIPSPAHTGRP